MVTRIIAPLIIAIFSCTASFAGSGDHGGNNKIVIKEGSRQVGAGAKKAGKTTGEAAKKVGKATGRAVTTGARKTGKAIRSVGAKTSDADGRIGD